MRTRDGDQIIIKIVRHNSREVIAAVKISYVRGEACLASAETRELREALAGLIKRWSERITEEK